MPTTAESVLCYCIIVPWFEVIPNRLCNGASKMATRLAVHYLWFGLVNPTLGWLAWLSPPLLEALQIWRPGGRCVTFGLFQ